MNDNKNKEMGIDDYVDQHANPNIKVTKNGNTTTIHKTNKEVNINPITNEKETISEDGVVNIHGSKDNMTKTYNYTKTVHKEGGATSHHENYSYSYSTGNNGTIKNRFIYKKTNDGNKTISIPKIITLIVIGIIIFDLIAQSTIGLAIKTFIKSIEYSNNFVILSTIENKDMEDNIVNYGKKNKIKIKFEYAEDLEAVSLINKDGMYDAIWASNSLWLYQIENASITNSKSISINPTVMAIKKSKATELGFVGRDITNSELINVIKEGKLKYVMSSPVKTNSGASSYLGFLNNLAGSPEVLKSEMLLDETLKTNMVGLFSGVERVSGTDTFLEDMFLNSSDYEAVIAAETSLIRINQELVKQNKEPLYLIYPTDGVAISDSPFAYIDRDQNKEEKFEVIQKYLLSETMQKTLEDSGRRTWYGGINNEVNKNVFNPEWGIDTTKYLMPQKYPSKKVITEATNLYIEEFRKPSHTVFLLDYSGSMIGDGNEELVDAMKYILTYEEASKDYIQFSNKDKITVIPFTSNIEDTWQTTNGKTTNTLLNNIITKSPGGGTDIYTASIKGLEILENESDTYTKTIILMTDGQSTYDNEYNLLNKYRNSNSNIPIYSIMFGDADSTQLEDLARLSNAKVFDGRYDLLEAFKEVRSFN